MFVAPTFSFSDVTEALRRLDVPFDTRGAPAGTKYAFKSLRKVEAGGIYFIAKADLFRAEIKDSIVLCPDIWEPRGGNAVIRVENPQLAFYLLMEALVGNEYPTNGIHPTALVDASSTVHPDAYIGPYCVLEGCVVEAGVKLHSHVTVMRRSIIERDVTVEPHSTIGATGVAWVWDPRSRRRVVQPQMGYTRIGAGSFLGSDISVVRGSVNETTTVGRGCVIAHGSKIAHGSLLGDECHFGNNATIAGSVSLGDRCFLGAGAVIRSNVRLADGITVGAGSVVVKDCLQPGVLLVGVPAQPRVQVGAHMTGVPTPLPSVETET